MAVLITLSVGLKLGNSPNGPSQVPSHVGSIHDIGILVRIPIHLNYGLIVFKNGPNKITKALFEKFEVVLYIVYYIQR